MFSGKLLEDHFASNRLGFVTACFPSSMASLILLVVMLFSTGLTLLGGVSVPPVLMTIHSPDGDVIDCIHRDHQPAFHHPLLRDHKIQEFPTGMPRIEKEAKNMWQVWHKAGQECPTGTIPILRSSNPSSVSHPKVFSRDATDGRMYGIALTGKEQNYYGTKATLNVWKPVVKAKGDFSLAHVWMSSGSYETEDVNTIEAGWQVWPLENKDNQPRLYTLWTADVYHGCYNVECPGFVQTSSRSVLGAALSPTSTFNGTQHAITLHIWKDSSSGNWWVAVDNIQIGYWPASLFTSLSHHATRIDWGGEVLYNNSSGLITTAQMGSGEFANKGWGKAAFVCNIEVAARNHTLLPLQEFKVLETNPEYFTVEKRYNKECGNHFYYGGPGPLRSLRSEASRESYSVATLITSFILLLLISV